MNTKRPFRPVAAARPSGETPFEQTETPHKSVGSEPPAGKTEGSDQIFLRAQKPLGIHSVRVGGKLFDVRENISSTLPFATRTTFTRVHAEKGRNFPVVPPLAGAFPVLQRDLVVELLRHAGTVAVADWLDPRFLPLSAGRFGFRENIQSLVEMIRAGGPDAHVVAVCQAVTPALGWPLVSRQGKSLYF